jgi:hypothetical protein
MNWNELQELEELKKVEENDEYIHISKSMRHYLRAMGG